MRQLTINKIQNLVKCHWSNVTGQRGFTLVELLVVIAIIGILIAFLSVSFFSVRERSIDAQRKSEIEEIRSALEQYRADHNGYIENAAYNAISCGNAFTGSGGTQYMQKLPCDPSTDTKYWYNRISPFTYQLVSCIDNEADNDPDVTATKPSFVTGTCSRYYVATNP